MQRQQIDATLPRTLRVRRKLKGAPETGEVMRVAENEHPLRSVEDGAQRTDVVEYRDEDGFLVAAALVDELSDGYSMVYSFFDPDLEASSLGNFMILDQIRRAQEDGLDYVYLGYWVPGSAKMHYKARYRPLEILDPTGWRRLTEEERQAKTSYGALR